VVREKGEGRGEGREGGEGWAGAFGTGP